MQVRVTEAFWELFPLVRIGVVAVYGLDNTLGAERAATLLADEARQRAAAIEGADIATHAGEPAPPC